MYIYLSILIYILAVIICRNQWGKVGIYDFTAFIISIFPIINTVFVIYKLLWKLSEIIKTEELKDRLVNLY